MGLLLLFSVISWGIILYKWWTFRGIEKHPSTFLDVFRKSAKFSEVQAVCPSLASSPLVGHVPGGLCRADGPAPAISAAPASPGTPCAASNLKSITAVDRALLRASSIEVNKLEKRVTFLATTASITPFIGLFGTVWGIMTAFMNIGAQGSTDLAVVSTPIAEALIATALGLFAAIPAVYFYNHFTVEGEELRVGDGRLRARVPEHLGKELHLVPKVMAQPDANTGRRRGRRVTTSLSEINVIPLVDVMLVLLIIFMVAAPMMQKGVEVNLPVARRADKMTQAEPLYVTVPASVSQGSPRLHRRRSRCRSTCWPSACGRRCRAAATSRCICAATARCSCRN